MLTDPGVLGVSDIAELQARKTILRAIERQRPAIHASQMGPSQLIDTKGRIITELTDWKTGLLVGELDAGPRAISIFSRTRGGFAPFISLLAMILLLFSIRVKTS